MGITEWDMRIIDQNNRVRYENKKSPIVSDKNNIFNRI